MNRMMQVAAAGMLCGIAAMAAAQQPAPNQGNAHVAGVAPLGVTVTAMDAVVLGWSAKKDVLGQAVVNDQNQKVGKIDDIIITPKDFVSYAIIGAGGFLGMAKHDVAVPMSQLQYRDNKFVLPGATKDALKALPAFEYRKGK
jgi:hypothetical protein